jgi:hypothetical protein
MLLTCPSTLADRAHKLVTTFPSYPMCEAMLSTHANNAASLNSEGARIATIPAHLPVSQVVTFQDQNATRNGNPQSIE